MPRLPKPDGCRGCVGDDWVHLVPNTRRFTEPRAGFSRFEGAGTNGVLIVGEALGQNEDADGLPFRPQAQAGSLLERAFKRLGYSRDQFRIGNIIRCRPPNDHLAGAPYEFDAIRHCRPYLDAELTTMKPRVIVALGGTAARELTGFSGEKQGVSHIRGYVVPSVLPSAPNIPVIPTFHPSFLRQGKPQYFGTLCHDLMRAVEYARHGVPPALPLHYSLHPSLEDAYAFLTRVRDNAALPLTYDIETPNSSTADEDERDELSSENDIIQIQFSLAAGEGIVFPWQDKYIDVARAILALPNVKYSFYGHLFDDPRLKAAGCAFGGPFPHDLYEMWHHMQPDLPANLQFVASFYGTDVAGPWKHLANSDSAFYGCADVDAPQRILARLPEQLRKRGLWDGYEGLVYRVRPILDRMSERGIPINDGRRLAFGSELDKAAAEVDAEMQAIVPEEVRRLHPPQGFKRGPECKGSSVPHDVWDGLATTFTKGKDADGEPETIPATWRLRKFKDYTDVDGPADPTGTMRWVKVLAFRPSSQQLIAYMKFRGHPVPRNIKEDRDTSAAAELERLAKKTHDPLYRKVIWYREVRLMKATFVDGWAPKADGRVHSTFTFAPATAQLSSRDPNVQNAPEHAKEGREAEGLADKFQRIIEAPPGYKIVSFDHKSFHALTLAFLADDPDYERIVRLDIHSFVAARFLKLKTIEAMMSYKDDELRDFLKWVKREHAFTRDFKCKRIILGWGFGRGARSIYNAYMESFTGEAEVKHIVGALESAFPKTVKWRKDIQFKAHYEPHYLMSPFGFLRWFWDVKHFDPKAGRLVNGDQAEQAIAFLPANCAFGMMRAQAREMDRNGLDERFGLINTVHDSYVFCTKDKLVDECVHTIGSLMETKCPVLKSARHPNGLWCAVSASVGQNRAKRTADNPQGREEIDWKSLTCSST